MDNRNVAKSKKSLIIKISIPILLILIVSSIWIFKNSQNNQSSGTLENKDSSNFTSNDKSMENKSNSDFALNVTEKLDLEKLKSYHVPIIIEFGSDSCIPCKQMAPIIEALNEDLQDKAIIKFVDVWKNQSLADGYPISVIPTQIFIDTNGKPYNPVDPNALQMIQYSDKTTNEHTFTAHEGTLTKEQLQSILKEMGMK
jgi:thioredoxin 1